MSIFLFVWAKSLSPRRTFIPGREWDINLRKVFFAKANKKKKKKGNLYNIRRLSFSGVEQTLTTFRYKHSSTQWRRWSVGSLGQLVFTDSNNHFISKFVFRANAHFDRLNNPQPRENTHSLWLQNCNHCDGLMNCTFYCFFFPFELDLSQRINRTRGWIATWRTKHDYCVILIRRFTIAPPSRVAEKTETFWS